MKRATLALTLVLAAPSPASDWDFNDIVREFESHYQTRRVSIPFLGLADFAASLVGAPFGMTDLQLAIFENVRADGRQHFAGRIPAGWRPVVRVRERSGEAVSIFGRDEGSWVRMLVMSVDGGTSGDAVLVSFRLRPTEVMRFVAERARHKAEWR
jgi:hypothetical protein